MRIVAAFFFLLSLFTTNTGAQTVPSAEAVLKESMQAAAAENKNVFIIFHASWCGWCHKMDTSMNDQSVKKYFTDNYIIRHLVVLEYDKNKHLENPGALQLLYKYHGKDSGIPYWLIFDKNGKLLADSKRRKEGEVPQQGANVGCPAEEIEVEYFIKVLRKTSRIDDKGLQIIHSLFLKNKE